MISNALISMKLRIWIEETSRDLALFLSALWR